MQIRINQGKGQKDRFSLDSQKVLFLLRKYVSKYKPKEYLFERQDDGKYSTSSIQTLKRNHKEICDIKKKAAPHTLRHGIATHLLDNRTDTRSTHKLPGHKHISTTQIYTHVSSRILKEVARPNRKFEAEWDYPFFRYWYNPITENQRDFPLAVVGVYVLSIQSSTFIRDII